MLGLEALGKCCAANRMIITISGLWTLWWAPWCELRPTTTYSKIVAFSLKLHSKSRLAAAVPVWGPPDESYNVSWDWPSLVLSLGPISKRCRLCWGQLLISVFHGSLRDFGKVCGVSRGMLLMWKNHWKMFGLAMHIGWRNSASYLNGKHIFGTFLHLWAG